MNTIDLSKFEIYYHDSDLQRIQDIEDEITALQRAREDARLAGANEQEIYEFDFELALCDRILFDIKILAN